MRASVERLVLVLRWGVVALLAAGLMVCTGRPLQAHKPITSKYTYTDHVLPILRERCGGCHVAGSVAPMSLLTYQAAKPWAESIRDELESERMPPWFVDATGPAARGPRGITAREIDTIITWAVGGVPEGPPARSGAAAEPRARWADAPPDVELPMPADHTLPAGVQEERHTIAVPTHFREDQWITGADLLPGAPAMVRDATISVEGGPVLAVWEPGSTAPKAPPGTAFRVPAGAALRLDIHYKKTWRDEQNALSDRSTVGLYVSKAPARDIESVTFAEFAGMTLDTPVTLLALRPAIDQQYAEIDVLATKPGGERLPLLRLHKPRPEWPYRYWLAQRIRLPAGTSLQTTTISSAPDPDAPSAPGRDPVRIGVDFIRQ